MKWTRLETGLWATEGYTAFAFTIAGSDPHRHRFLHMGLIRDQAKADLVSSATQFSEISGEDAVKMAVLEFDPEAELPPREKVLP